MNPVFSGLGNKQHTRQKVVRYEGTDAIYEGMLVCYNHDTTTNPTGGDAISVNNPGVHYFVEKPSSGNYKAFAGVVAGGSYQGLSGPREIVINVPNGAVVPVRVYDADVSRDDAIYLVEGQYYANTTPAAGKYIGRAFESRNLTGTEGLVLVQLSGNAGEIDFVGDVTGDVTGDLTGNVDATVYNGDVTSGAPSASELAAILGAPGTAGRVRIVVADGGTGSGESYICVDDGTAWTYVALTASV